MLRIEIDGKSISIPCTNKAIKVTNNPRDDPKLKNDMIDDLVNKEMELCATHSESIHLNRPAPPN